jgi:hypothetical protein
VAGSAIYLNLASLRLKSLLEVAECLAKEISMNFESLLLWANEDEYDLIAYADGVLAAVRVGKCDIPSFEPL